MFKENKIINDSLFLLEIQYISNIILFSNIYTKDNKQNLNLLYLLFYIYYLNNVYNIKRLL